MGSVSQTSSDGKLESSGVTLQSRINIDIGAVLCISKNNWKKGLWMFSP
jgi:hypothetical protein